MTSFTRTPVAEMTADEVHAEITSIEQEITSDGNEPTKFIVHFGHERMRRLHELKASIPS